MVCVSKELLSFTSSSGGSALAAFRRVFFASMLFLCLLVDSAVAGPCRDLVDLNARAARGAAFDELGFNPCISTEASRFV